MLEDIARAHLNIRLAGLYADRVTGKFTISNFEGHNMRSPVNPLRGQLVQEGPTFHAKAGPSCHVSGLGQWGTLAMLTRHSNPRRYYILMIEQTCC
jgi:hypothetical protein